MMKQVLHLGYIKFRLSKSSVTYKILSCFVNIELYERTYVYQEFL